MADIEDLVREEIFESRGTAQSFDLSDDFCAAFRADLVSWYEENRRRMPWRGDDTSVPVSAYGVWVSEVMLQQTRVETVVDYWLRWMQAFPSVAALASATPDEVNRLWAGLGYYRRAQNLLAGAKYIVERHNGSVPGTVQELLLVPGIGPYTAGAVASIAFAQREPVVDGNVLRVFSRVFASRLEVGAGKLDKLCWSLGRVLVDETRPASFNQALMELGATLCKPTNPACDSCPVRKHCRANKLVQSLGAKDNAELTEIARSVALSSKLSLPADLDERIALVPREVTLYPRKTEKKKAKEVRLLLRVLCGRVFNGVASSSGEDDKFLFVRRPAKGLLANQWEFPNIEVRSTAAKVEEEEEEQEAENGEESTLELHTQNRREMDAHLLERCSSQFLSTQSDNTNSGSNTSSATIFLESRGSPLALPAPIVHIFSHERHTMHVVVEEVSVTHEESATDSSRLCWMTAREITAAGVTTGCKKVLQQVEQLLSQSADENEKHSSKRGKSKKLNTVIKIDVDECEDDKADAEAVPKDAFAAMKQAAMKLSTTKRTRKSETTPTASKKKK